MTKIEEVARGIWERRRKWAAENYGHTLEEWGDGSIPRLNGVMEEARDAIAAMREPTIDMIINLAGYEESSSEKAEGWRDAIDAALKETP